MRTLIRLALEIVGSKEAESAASSAISFSQSSSEEESDAGEPLVALRVEQLPSSLADQYPRDLLIENVFGSENNSYRSEIPSVTWLTNEHKLTIKENYLRTEKVKSDDFRLPQW